MSNSVDEVVKTLVSRFTSGNEIPVRQSRILRDEWDAIRSTITAQQKRIEALEEALNEIAEWDDDRANDKLRDTGSYAAFDEPAAVATAREALNEATQTQHNDPFDPTDPHSST